MTFSAGAGTFTVTGAIGDLSSQGYGIIQGDVAGGIPPYTETLTVQGDASGKLSVAPNGLGADTIGYSGFSLNEIEGGYLQYSVTDGAARHATSRFPATGALIIQRTS